MNAVHFIPWFPALAAVLCGVCCTKKAWRGFAAPIAIASIAIAFLLSVIVSTSDYGSGAVVHSFNWINIGDFSANFSYYIDALTIVMLFVVTGIGTLVAIYGSGYMKGDRGYARFFAAVSLFIFAMTALVLADNLVLLYLGWEGVGVCSYLLIGYYYDKPSAVAAAKKAFIVNRIGDLGFAIGIFLIWLTFGSVEYATFIPAAQALLPGGSAAANLTGDAAVAYAAAQAAPQGYLLAIPFLLMLGAFGKSAQIPLYVWLPDAMEGPTPVSALIHAATMVTAGVYMIARLLPIFELSPYALPTVATIGAATALFAALIALCQYDLKRVFAYSTVSQLGYMFLGVGAVSTVGGVFHLFTHAFFKALLFLTAGSVMHALAGQLDLRKISGLRTKMPITGGLMLLGCLALAGFPFFAGFFSKDMILSEVLDKGINESKPLFIILAIVGLVTALLTAYYTFRLWFRVFMGPTHYEMGDEHHHEEVDDLALHTPGDAEQIAAEQPHHAPAAGHHAHEPHEMPWLMNGPLVVLAVGAVFAGAFGGWIERMIGASTAAVAPHHYQVHTHQVMMFISAGIALLGIAIAAYFHLFNRPAADRAAARMTGLVRLLENKFYIDEVYDAAIVRPLRLAGEIFFAIDALIVDGLVNLVGMIPGLAGRAIQPAQTGRLQGYGLGMAAGAAALGVILLLLL